MAPDGYFSGRIWTRSRECGVQMTKYAALADHLKNLKTDRWHARFVDIEHVLGFGLPVSARQYSAWWANTRSSHPHAATWLDEGWHTCEVAVDAERITFVRASRSAAPKKRRKAARTWVRIVDHQHPTDKPQPWDSADELAADVRLVWRPIGRVVLDETGRPVLPTVLSSPGVYRFRIRLGGKERQYVGEAVNLRRRFNNFRNPGASQKTSLRINEILREAFAAGAEIAVSQASDALLIASDGTKIPVDLSDRATRRLIEHFAQVVQGDEEIDSLNR